MGWSWKSQSKHESRLEAYVHSLHQRGRCIEHAAMHACIIGSIYAKVAQAVGQHDDMGLQLQPFLGHFFPFLFKILFEVQGRLEIKAIK